MNVAVNVRNTGPQMFARLKAKAPAAIARSLNRGIVGARTVIVPLMAKDLGLPQREITSHSRDNVRTVEARPGKFFARLAASLNRIPLIRFGAKGARPRKGKGQGVTVKGKRYPHAFIATMPGSGHIGVFQRRPNANRRGPKPNRSQLPIFELRGASLGRVFVKYRELGKARAIELFHKNIHSEFKFALKG